MPHYLVFTVWLAQQRSVVASLNLFFTFLAEMWLSSPIPQIKLVFLLVSLIHVQKKDVRFKTSSFGNSYATIEHKSICFLNGILVTQFLMNSTAICFYSRFLNHNMTHIPQEFCFLQPSAFIMIRISIREATEFAQSFSIQVV